MGRTIIVFGSFILFLAVSPANGTCSLAAPKNLSAKNIKSCSMELSWKKVTGASYYTVRYKAPMDTAWTYTGNLTTTKVTLTGLQASTTYEVAVASFCSNHTTQGYSTSIFATTAACSAPTSLSAAVVLSYEATLRWKPVCGIMMFRLQYRIVGGGSWITISDIADTSYVLQNLQASTLYEARVASQCGTLVSGYTSKITFTTLMAPPDSRKNILFVFLDDGRFDVSALTGGPDWLQTPAINRIAEEGVNFQIAVATTAQCAPSRASVYTGMYAHVHGVRKNGDPLNAALTLVQTLLQQRGYYTGFIGKYGQNFGNPQGFHWWAVTKSSAYMDQQYTVNGVTQFKPGHTTDIDFQLAKEFIATVPSQTPFALFYFTRVPHHPTNPRSVDTVVYAQQSITVPSNFSFYSNSYPSYYQKKKWNADTAEAIALIRKTHQCNYGLDQYIDSFFHILTERNALDSTLIIFSSDNGFLMGEHKMNGKVVALEESIRVPLLVRYPAWFPAGLVVTDQIAANVDIPVTLLEFAGIANTYGFQGLSLRALANGSAARKSIVYEFDGEIGIPAIRAVRGLHDKYIRSYCQSVTEEYYDLVNDPNENTNLIFDPQYQNQIARSRFLLDSLRATLNDTEPSLSVCSLITSSKAGVHSTEVPVSLVPVPADRQFTLEGDFVVGTEIRIRGMLNNVMYRIRVEQTVSHLDVVCADWPAGMYVVEVRSRKGRFAYPLLIAH